MATIVALSGSPSPVSRTAVLTAHVAARLTAAGHDVRTVVIRDLPASPLVTGDAGHPAIAEVIDSIDAADGIVVASPVFKASYSGLLKVLLDLLPQFALRDKVVLPVVTGGSQAHVLAIDYALRPVLSSLGATHVVPGWFVLDRHIDHTTGLTAEAALPLHDVVTGFDTALRRATLSFH